MSTVPAIHAGARQIIQRCLGMEPNQQLVIFVDETTVEPAVVIAEAADSLGISHTLILVPTSIQRRIPDHSDLSLLAQGVAREARAILTCINAAPECLPFRERILETHWTARTRIGHMPGATLRVLELADVDFEQLVADCHCMEVAMARGRTLELVSYAADGKPHALTADIGGWERLPVSSDGVIGDGVWGNVPSGETYIALIEGSSRGSIVINGSIPGLLIEPGTEMTLHFEHGRLSNIEPADGQATRWLHETQIQRAQAVGDPHWSNLAEIGVGMNPAVQHLTGNMLFDEKAAGTAHVALGSNTFMGGTLNASIHCDMVTKGSTILIDGKTIVDRGHLRFEPADWQEHHAAISLHDSPLFAAVEVARSGIQTGEAANGRLQRILRPEPGRISACLVGDDETARLAYALYKHIPNEGEWLEIEELSTSAGMDRDPARRVLHILWKYDLVRVR